MKIFKRSRQEVPKRRQAERPVAGDTTDTATFRRGRTLTGSASSLIRSANESQADLKSSRVQAHELRHTRRRIGSIFVATVVLAGGLFILVSQFTAHATVQATPDPSLQLADTYEKAIDDYLGNHLNERWRFLTNTDNLSNYLQTVTPEVKKATVVGTAGFGRSLFQLTFREPIASWEVNGQQLYVDASGVPFKKNYFRSPSLRITDQSGMSSSSPGQSIMSNRFMSYIGQVIGLTKAEGRTVTNIVIPPGMTRQIEVHLDGVSYPFKLTSDRSAGESVHDMMQSLEWMQSHGRAPEYVDVRVDGKVFYK